MPTRARLLLLLAGVSMGCVEPKLPIIESGSTMTLRGPTELQVCAGTFARGEAEIEEIRASYMASDGPIEYHWLPEGNPAADEIDFPCTTSDYACSLGTSVYARTLASTHELVHAARAPGLPLVLEEGLATLLDEPSQQALAPRAEFEQALMQGSWSATPSLYERAGHFMSFLLAWGGAEALRSLEESLSSQTDDAYELAPAQLEAHLIEIYGVGLDQLLTEYEGYPDCDPARFHLPISACALLASGATPSVTINASIGGEGTADEWLESLDCEDSTSYGPVNWGGVDTRGRNRLIQLELPIAVSVQMRLQGEVGPGTRASLTNCGDCWSGSGARVSALEPNTLVTLESGLHVLTLHQDLDLRAEFGVEFSY